MQVLEGHVPTLRRYKVYSISSKLVTYFFKNWFYLKSSDVILGLTTTNLFRKHGICFFIAYYVGIVYLDIFRRVLSRYLIKSVRNTSFKKLLSKVVRYIRYCWIMVGI